MARSAFGSLAWATRAFGPTVVVLVLVAVIGVVWFAADIAAFWWGVTCGALAGALIDGFSAVVAADRSDGP